jgi:ABC-2 type transport system permease protein
MSMSPMAKVQSPKSMDPRPKPDAPTAAPAPAFARYAGIYAALWKNSVTREMNFKANFLLWIAVEVLWFAMQLVFIGVLYRQTQAIGTWTEWQVIMLVGASSFIQQVFQAFFLVNMTNLSDLVRTGKLDFLLLLPVNSRFVISLRQVDLGSFVNAAFALVVMAYAAHQMHYTPSPGQVAGFFALALVGIGVHYSLMFLLATVSFWTVRAQGIVWAYYNLFQIARLPDEAFRGVFKAVFTFALPMLLVVNVPVRLVAGKVTDPAAIAQLLLLAVVCALGSEWWWNRSLRHYTSASS